MQTTSDLRLHRLAMLVLIGSILLNAQEYRATLLGTVTDSSGAVIPAARVTAINRDTGVATNSEANSEGGWLIPYLLPGVYELRVEQSGFKTYQRSPIELRINDRLRIDIGLEVGETSDRVTVTAEAPLLEAASSGRGQVIDNRKITDLPLNAHNPFTLMNLGVGVQYTGNITWSRPYDSGAIGAFSISGGRNGSNEYQIDGAPNNRVGDNNLAYVPPVEATQEFKIQTNTYDAQYGRTGGGIISVSIKSGTNNLHGAGYEYLRRTGLDANQFVNNANGRPRTRDVIDQYGVALNGPVYVPKLYNGKDRTFFTFAMERYRQIQPRPALGSVPTPQQREGDFSNTLTSAGRLYTIYDPLTIKPNPAFSAARPVSVTNPQFIRSPFANNRLPLARLDPIALNVLKDIPPPNQEGDSVTRVNNWFAPEVTSDDKFRNIVARVDHSFSNSLRIYGRWNDSYRDGSRRNNNGWTTNAGLLGSKAQRRNRGAVFDVVETLDPRTVLSARVAFNWYRSWKKYPPVDISYLGFPKSLLNQLQTANGRYPQFIFNGYLQTSEQNFDDLTNESYSAQANVLKIVSSHTVRFGTELRLLRYANRAKSNDSGTYNFDRNWTSAYPQVLDANSGNSIASFMAGYLASGVATLNAAPYVSWRYPVAFVQDDWQVSRKLTLNMGLRWDYDTPPVERFNRQGRGFDFTAKSPAQLPGYDLRGGLLFAGVGGQPRGAFDRDLNNWQPRLGAAFKPLASKPVVFRSGFGRYFLPATEFGGLVGFSQPTDSQVSTADFLPLHVLANPFPNGLIQPSGASLGLATMLGDAVSFSDPRRVIPYVWQYSAGVQFEIVPGFLVESSYVGSQTRQLQVGKGQSFLTPEQLALGTPYLSTVVTNPFYGVLPVTKALGAQPTVQRRSLITQYPQFTSVAMNNQSLGKSWYNSFQLKIEQRMKHGLFYLVSYTVSKTMEAVAFLNAADTSLSRELADFDVAQRLVFSGVYEFPVGPRKRWFSQGVASHIVGGWQLSWSSTIQSGPPMPLPNYYIQGNPRLQSGQNLNRWFDTNKDIWVQPPSDTLRVTKLKSPTIRRYVVPQHDLTLIRDFRIREGHRFQFKVTAFNATNSAIFDFPNTNLTSQLFGVVPITQINLPRNVELGFRYAF